MAALFSSAAAQKALEEGDEEGRGTPLVPEQYFGGDGSTSSAFLHAQGEKNAEAPRKFVFRDPFGAEKETRPRKASAAERQR